MRKLGVYCLALLGLAWLSACVTINVYFPAAAAEKAADKIIDQVWGEQGRPGETGNGEEADTPPKDHGESGEEESSATDSPQSSLSPAPDWLGRVVYALIPPAEAVANFDISTPSIQALEKSMAARHQILGPYYDNGALGLTHHGLITVRDPAALPLPMRARINKAVDEENEDRLALYQEIAVANGHPEWEEDIRQTFARRWIDRAKRGWWYQDESGAWLRK